VFDQSHSNLLEKIPVSTSMTSHIHHHSTVLYKSTVENLWRTAIQGPSQGQPIEDWVIKLQTIYHDGVLEKISVVQTNDCAPLDFMDAVRHISPIWHNRVYHELICKINARIQIDFDELCFGFSQNLQIEKPRKTSLRQSYATFQNIPDQAEQSNSGLSKRIPCCHCQNEPNDGNHWFQDCAYLDPSKRPANYTWDEDVESRFEKAASKSVLFKEALERFTQRTGKDTIF
jgi:hypothetical protein